AYGESGDVWHERGDAAAAVLAAVFDEAAWANLEFGESERNRVIERIEQLLVTGQQPPTPSYESEEAAESFEIVTVTVSDEGITGQARLGERFIVIQLPTTAISFEIYDELRALARQLIEGEVSRLASDMVSSSSRPQSVDQ